MILIVEDDDKSAKTIESMLGVVGLPSKRVTSLKEAMEMCRSMDFDVIILDLMLPDSVGLDTAKVMMAIATCTPVIVVSGVAVESVAQMAIDEGAAGVLHKGSFSVDIFLRALSNAFDIRDAKTCYGRIQSEIDSVKSEVTNARREVKNGG